MASSDMQLTSSSVNPIMDAELTIQPGEINIEVDTTCWEDELQLIVKPPTEDEAGSKFKALEVVSRRRGAESRK